VRVVCCNLVWWCSMCAILASVEGMPLRQGRQEVGCCVPASCWGRPSPRSKEHEGKRDPAAAWRGGRARCGLCTVGCVCFVTSECDVRGGPHDARRLAKLKQSFAFHLELQWSLSHTHTQACIPTYTHTGSRHILPAPPGLP